MMPKEVAFRAAAAFGGPPQTCEALEGRGVKYATGDGSSEIRGPGGGCRPRVCGMRWKDRIYQFWISPAGQQPRLMAAKTTPGRKIRFEGSKGGRLNGSILIQKPAAKREIVAGGAALFR